MALEVLVSDGVAAVHITELARRLNISKSGFYWHFKDRSELLDAMKAYWVEEFNERIISEVLATEGPLHDRLLHVVRVIRGKKSGLLDLAFMSWAQSEPEVRALVDRVTDIRIDFIKTLLVDAGFDEADAMARARLFVVYFAWSEVMFQATPGRRDGEDLERILTAIAGPA